MELTGSIDLARERSTVQSKSPYSHNCNATKQTRGHTSETVTVEREFNTVTSPLFRRNMTKREYGTEPSEGLYKPTTNFRHILRLQPALFHPFRKIDDKRTTPPAVVTGDRRNEFFALKRFIFMTLGMPSTPAINPFMQKLSSK